LIALGHDGLKSLFRKDGDPWFMVPEAILSLDPFWRDAAYEVWCVLLKYVREWGELDERLITRRIAEELESKHGHRCYSFVQKGLFALEYLPGPAGERQAEQAPRRADKAVGLIRRVRKHGRRIITFLHGLLGNPETRNKAGPPSTPPGGIQGTIQETTTTREASSSSLAPLPGDGPELPEDLVDAVGLVPDLSRERLAGWVAMFGVDLARRGVAWLRAWLCHPRAEHRPQVAYWAEKALLGWKSRLERGELAMGDVDAQIEAKRKKWAPRPVAAKAEPKEKAAEEARGRAREHRLKAAWEALAESDREAIRSAVKAANPESVRFPGLLEPLYLSELERRL
jgi:hypothetical protein